MRYTIELDLDVPRSKVIEYFDNPDNMSKWQPDLVSFEHVSGEQGQAGAKSNLVYRMGKREIEMLETITERNLPDTFSGTYEAKGCWNEVNNRFIENGPEKTKWRVDTEFRCSGFFMKVMSTLMPGAFRKQTSKYMKQFKAFAENEYGSQSLTHSAM